MALPEEAVHGVCEHFHICRVDFWEVKVEFTIGWYNRAAEALEEVMRAGAHHIRVDEERHVIRASVEGYNRPRERTIGESVS